MKADRMGTWTEQVRFRMGWKSPSERKVLGKTDSNVCVNCHWFFAKEIPNRDGGCANYSSYCGHPTSGGHDHAGGHATRDTASCDNWARKS